ncbi:MAG: CAP domain-containing protein [Patescibacteria group bacterium]
MNRILKNKFILWNLLALIFVKAIFSYSGLQFASLLDGVAVFSKEEVISQTNLFRKTLGLNELKQSSVLNLAAAQKLQDMSRNQYFAHTSPSGISPWHWIEVNKYKYSYAGENLAIGFFSAKDTVDAWANSPSHRANLSNSNFKEIGIAVAPTKINNTEGFLVVQLFGTPRPTIAPKPVKTPAIKPSPIISKSTVIPSPKPGLLKPAVTQIIDEPILEESYALEIETPIASKVNPSSENFSRLSKIINTSFIFYTLIIFLVSAVLLFLKKIQKDLIIQTAASLAILILAIVIPVIQISRTALIL